MKRILTILVGFLINALLMAQNISQIEEKLKKYIDDNQTPGIQYLVIKNGEIVFEYNGGKANFENNLPVTSQTVFRAYSITKTFTALAIMQLVDKGKLNLDDPASKYLKNYPYKNDFTIRHLLSHTAGLPNPFPKWVHYANDHTNFNKKDARSFIVNKYNKLKSKPGEKASYSNIGYLLLGMIIENVSGKTYENYIEDNIIKHMDISQQYAGYLIPPSNNYAKGYNKSNAIMVWFYTKIFGKELIGKKLGKWITLNDFYLDISSYGGLITNCHVLGKYAYQLYFNENAFIPDNLKNEMFTPVKLNSGKINGKKMYGKKISICLSWLKTNLNEKNYYEHPGNAAGYSCDLRIYPNEKLVTVVMMNRSPKVSDLKFLDKLDSYFLQ